MSNLIIVAIPQADDYVHQISSEKVAHCTLLFLGDVEGKPVLRIAEFLQHAVSILEFGPFGLSVDHRGTLGEDKADVLFFKKDWGYKWIAEFRSQLLKNNSIRDAYDSTEQFPEWLPHLTLGYPETPAKEDKRDYPGTRWVEFDRIALWFGDFEGPEFRLEYNYDLAEVSMSAEADRGEKFISHYGVKGMRWGSRKAAPAAVAPSVSSVVPRGKATKTKIKAKGGENHPAAQDAINAAVSRQKLKRSGAHALSNKELQELATRMNLEQQVSRLAGQHPRSAGKKFVDDILKDPAKTIDTGVRVASIATTASKLR